MDAQKRYQQWLDDPALTSEDRAALRAMGPEEIREAFHQELSFGTAGLRGIRGLGSNRMNIYVIRRVTQAYATVLLERYASLRDHGVYIAYDPRHQSREFAREAARVFSANGIPAYLFDDYRSTPQLSYVIRQQRAMGGLMLTASHNPADYNGYKAYNPLGCQLSTGEADAVLRETGRLREKGGVRVDPGETLVRTPDPSVDASFLAQMKRLHQGPANPDLRIVYTPLHGVAGAFTRQTLESLGYDLRVVEEEFSPDGDFPGTPRPNPEEPAALERLLRAGEGCGADLLMAADPDGDRLGVVIRHGGAYRTLHGNQVGALLLDHLLETRGAPGDGWLVKSVVSGNLSSAVAGAAGLRTADTLTGFRFIGDKIEELAREGRTVVFAFEESIGYLPGDYIRDKDGIGAAVAVAEMAGRWKARGMTLADRLEELYARHGFFAEETMNLYFEGAAGRAQMEALMECWRRDTPAFGPDAPVGEALDFLAGVPGFAPSDVLYYRLGGGSWIAIRPSGTEPKIKVYISVVRREQPEAEAALGRIRDAIHERIRLFRDAWTG